MKRSKEVLLSRLAEWESILNGRGLDEGDWQRIAPTIIEGLKRELAEIDSGACEVE